MGGADGGGRQARDGGSLATLGGASARPARAAALARPAPPQNKRTQHKINISSKTVRLDEERN